MDNYNQMIIFAWILFPSFILFIFHEIVKNVWDCNLVRLTGWIGFIGIMGCAMFGFAVMAAELLEHISICKCK